MNKTRHILKFPKIYQIWRPIYCTFK